MTVLGAFPAPLLLLSGEGDEGCDGEGGGGVWHNSNVST